MKKSENRHVFIIGSKGIPANYGGFETFVERLTYYSNNPEIKYHVSCVNYNDDINNKEFNYNNAHCFKISVPSIGSAKAIIYDLKALDYCIKYIKKNNIDKPIIYILACRIGPFIKKYKKQIVKLGGLLYVNPDGHEWLRAKWNYLIKKYWKISEKLMVKYADLLICDNKCIEKYILNDYYYYKPKTAYIAYGSEMIKTKLNKNSKNIRAWYKLYDIKPNNYYLAVGRFVPENNFETMIKEFMNSKTKKDFVLITTMDKNFFEELSKKLNFKKDKRIKFVNAVYNQELLKYIRENAYGYIHGHEVGGTNPSLLEALSMTKMNLVLDVCFNMEVCGNGVLYWNKNKNSLKNLIDYTEKISCEEIEKLGNSARCIINDNYTWDIIVKRYEKYFLNKND